MKIFRLVLALVAVVLVSLSFGSVADITNNVNTVTSSVKGITASVLILVTVLTNAVLSLVHLFQSIFISKAVSPQASTLLK